MFHYSHKGSETFAFHRLSTEKNVLAHAKGNECNIHNSLITKMLNQIMRLFLIFLPFYFVSPKKCSTFALALEKKCSLALTCWCVSSVG